MKVLDRNELTAVPARLLALRDEIFKIESMDTPIQYNLQNWKRWLPNDPDLRNIIERFPHKILRADVNQFGCEAMACSQNVRSLFIGSMVWGYGDVGYGAYRTARMLESTNISGVAMSAFARLVYNDIHSAYERLLIRNCGPAFMTKFLYFAGSAAGTDPLPVILDSRVGAELLKLSSEGDFPFSRCVKINRSGFVRWFPRGYVNYVDIINKWSSNIGCRPDSIEKFLFDGVNCNHFLGQIYRVVISLRALLGTRTRLG